MIFQSISLQSIHIICRSPSPFLSVFSLIPSTNFLTPLTRSLNFGLLVPSWIAPVQLEKTRKWKLNFIQCFFGPLRPCIFFYKIIKCGFSKCLPQCFIFKGIKGGFPSIHVIRIHKKGVLFIQHLL